MGTDVIGGPHDYLPPRFRRISKSLHDIAESGVKHQKSINHMKFSVTEQE